MTVSEFVDKFQHIFDDDQDHIEFSVSLWILIKMGIKKKEISHIVTNVIWDSYYRDEVMNLVEEAQKVTEIE